MKRGILYGVGVGPGDSELLTLKAVRTIERTEILAVPGAVKEQTVAYKIVEQEMPKVKEKECLCLHMPMTKDKQLLADSYQKAAVLVEQALDRGKDVAFLTLGDPTIYSTYIYIKRLVEQDGYESRIINGVPSFCAAAAVLNESLAERSQQIHIVPSSYGVEEALQLPGTKVLMKAGKKMEQVKTSLRQTGGQISMVENCGMEGQSIYRSAEDIPSDAGYYSLIIVKDEQKGTEK